MDFILFYQKCISNLKNKNTLVPIERIICNMVDEIRLPNDVIDWGNI